MNRSYFANEGVNINFYIDTLCKTLKIVTCEVYIWCLILTASDLEKIVKASSNSERLVIRFWDISCSTALNFTTSDKYNTKFLSFSSWGNCNKSSGFKSVPSSFENIVEAIAKSGLMVSLQTLEIWNTGLDKKSGAGIAQQGWHEFCFSYRKLSRAEGVIINRKTAKLIEFRESDCLDLKTLWNSLNFNQRLKIKKFKTLNRIFILTIF